jgi:hypothetical protein
MQQAKGYSECERFDAKYVFSTNGHIYAKWRRDHGHEQKASEMFGAITTMRAAIKIQQNDFAQLPHRIVAASLETASSPP